VQSAITYTQTALTYTQTALAYTQTALAYTQTAITYTQTAITYTQTALTYTQTAIAYKQSAITYKQTPVWDLDLWLTVFGGVHAFDAATRGSAVFPDMHVGPCEDADAGAPSCHCPSLLRPIGIPKKTAFF
jgi:hypothetical protein